jgi:hypothetical protein
MITIYAIFMMKQLFTFVRKFLKINSPQNPLGRWKIEYCDKKTNNKIDLSNEDHCGPCGHYALEKIKIKQNKIK